MIDAPSLRSGKAFCTVKKVPLTLMLNVRSKSSSVTSLSGAASPMPAKVALPVPVIFNWTGCYIGAEGGGNWGRGEQLAQSGPNAGTTMTGNYSLKGGIAGGTAGCQMQTSNFVFGLEDDYSWTNKKGSAFDLPPFDVTATNGIRERWIDTLRGRFGYVPIDRLMLYLTGGAAFAGVTT